MAATTNIVNINVGGKVFQTTASTLKPGGQENFFSALLSGRVPVVRDAAQNIFIDRDGEIFEVCNSLFLKFRVFVIL